jgi:PadR family transcriptional regulator PadR
MAIVQRRTKTTARVLAAFLAAPGDEHYGLALVRATGLLSGTLYPILDRLVGDGWLSARWETDDATKGPRRRFYRITPLGREQAEAWLSDTSR